MAGYVRQAAASIVPGAEITATPLNNEFNALQNAFSGSTGHGHTGGAGDGPKISLTTSVSGILPVANGGTGVSTIPLLRTDLYNAVIPLGVAGSATAPAYSFLGDSNTGMWNAAADTLGFVTNGVTRLTLSASTLTSTLPVYVPLGTETVPSYSFAGDTNTGIYSPAADQVAITAAGVQQALFTSTTNTIVGSTTFTGALSTSSNLSVTGTSTLTGAVTIGGNINMDGNNLISSSANLSIRPNTSSGADDKQVSLLGGGGYATSRGAILAVYGVNHAIYPGTMRILAGAGGTIEISGTVNTTGALNTGGDLTVTGKVTATGTVTGASFSGVGTALTALNASNLSSGTVPNARLSGSYTGLTNLTGSGTVDFAKFLGNASDSQAAPSYTWTGDTDTGMWYAGADSIGFACGGVNIATITSTELTVNRLRLTSNTSTSLVSTTHAFQIGSDTGNNLAISWNRIQARNNGAAGVLALNPNGGADVTINGQVAWHAGNLVSPVESTTTITAGNGLSGGGTLAANRTISMGTPGTLSATTANGVTTTSHTHNINTTSVVSDGMSSLAVGAVGTYALISHNGTVPAGGYEAGSTVAGSALRYSNASGQEGTSLSGTWKIMGRLHGGASNTGAVTVAMRIS